MGDTTKAYVLLIASELSVVTNDDIWTLILSDVTSEVGTAYGTKQERAQRYLTAHYMTLATPSNVSPSSSSGPLVSESIGKRRVAFSDKAFSDHSRLDETKYGRIFTDIRSSCSIGLMVFTP